jgi:hypothetical protein
MSQCNAVAPQSFVVTEESTANAEWSSVHRAGISPPVQASYLVSYARLSAHRLEGNAVPTLFKESRA